MSDGADVAAITTQLYNILKSLEPSDRKRVVRAALMLLDDNIDALSERSSRVDLQTVEEDVGGEFLPKVRTWMQKNDITSDQLSNVFHLEGDKAEIIAGDVSGKNGKEKTINAYLLAGMRNFIVSGESKFDDKDAREVCKNLGVYSESNHSTYIKDKGNIIGGSKSSGWIITAPGLKAGAEMIKALSEA